MLSVNQDEQSMNILLVSKIENMPDHTAKMSLEWVTEQDQDLVRPGAIFYLTMYKETRQGSIRNAEELRFQRLPNWSRSQIEQIYVDAERLLTRFSDKNNKRLLSD